MSPPQPVKARRSVKFANSVPDGKLTTVHVVPRGGRGYEPGFVARSRRVHALHKLHGLPVSRYSVDDEFGHSTTKGRFTEHVKGTRGMYTDLMARRDMWHAAKHGTPWYEAMTMNGKTIFVKRFGADEHARKVAEMAADHIDV